MNATRGVTVGVAAALFAHTGSAFSQSLPGRVFNDFKYAATDILHLYTFPFRLDGRSAVTLGLVIATSGATLLVDDDLDGWIVAHPDAGLIAALQPFRVNDSFNLEDMGSGRTLIGAAAALYLTGLVFGSEGLRDAGIGCATAEKSQTLLRGGVYKLISRSRPMAAEGDAFRFDVPGGDWYSRSFWGGHAANIMSCASFIHHRFRLGLAEPLFMGLATGVGLGRVADRAHWLSDTVVGMAAGYFMGRTVARRQLERQAEREGRTENSEHREAGSFFAMHDGARFLVGWRRSF
jgi:membrane-associated phospholipid phosphatase